MKPVLSLSRWRERAGVRVAPTPSPNPLPQAAEGFSETLATAVARGGNNLDLIRLAAALLVLGSHAYILTGHADDEPIGIATRQLVDGGSLAVAVFFILSGFLIARSAGRRSPGAYLRARARRLYPAFLVLVVVQTLLLGSALTTLPLATYLASPATWSAIPRALIFSVPPTLPGVFQHNPLPAIVNGSLWTLRLEALCYLGLLALSLTGNLRPGRILIPLAIGWAAQAAIIAARHDLLPSILASLPVVALVDCTLHFLMGAALWIYAAKIPQNLWLAGAAAVALIALPTPAILHLILPYVVLAIGLTRPILAPIPDLSYGTYLYAFPIQQTVTAMTGITSPTTLIALTIPPTLLLAAASHSLVERRAS